MEIEVMWSSAEDEEWKLTECLYAYLHPDTDKILYIGKADGTSVKQRFTSRDKDGLFKFLNTEFGLTSDNITVIVGEIYLEENRRFTSELLADVESLLIKRIKPPGNIQSTKSRISRPGLIVECTGEWPHRLSRFVDRG